MIAKPGSSLTIIETSRDDALAFEVHGRLGETDLHNFAEQVNAILKVHPPKRMIGRLADYEGFELPALFDREYLAMKLGLALAIKVLDPIFAVDVRHFDLADEPAAWAWIGAEPLPERALVA
jgi:hypothetical protein